MTEEHTDVVERLEELVDEWREVAPRMATAGNAGGAGAYQSCADDLQRVINQAREDSE